MTLDGWFWTVQAEDFQENILDGVILVYNRHSEQSVCNLTKRRTLPLVFPGEIFENEWQWTAASEQFKIAACHVIRFLTIKFFSAFFYNITLNINIEFLKIATSEPIVSTEQAWPWSFEICTQRNFNNLIKQNQKLGSDSVLQSTVNDTVQGPESSTQSPESRVQLSRRESRNSGMPFKNL